MTVKWKHADWASFDLVPTRNTVVVSINSCQDPLIFEFILMRTAEQS